MAASMRSFEKRILALRAALPKEVIATLEKYEKSGSYDAPEYQQTVFEKVYTTFLCRLNPWPEPVSRAMRNFNLKMGTERKNLRTSPQKSRAGRIDELIAG
jgi:proline iminopeptidase